MFVFLMILILLIIFSLKVKIKGINEEYLSKDSTLAIKGIFVIFVFLSHVRTYTDFTLTTDKITISVLDYLGQLMVALFLFYSGYGIFEAIKAKGIKYINSIPTKRIGSTFIDFSFALLLFLIINSFIGKSYPLNHIILSFTGWTSIGNSNWYMFTIFTLYLLTYVSFKLNRNKKILGVIIFTILSLIYVYVLSRLQPSRFSNTALCYTSGMWYSYFKVYIDNFFKKYNNLYYIVTFLVIAAYLIAYPYKGVKIMYFNGVSILFCLSIIMLSMKFSITSKILKWFGVYLFWIYILQRIPMILLSYYGLAKSSPYVYLLLTFVITLILSYYINKFMSLLKKKIYKLN